MTSLNKKRKNKNTYLYRGGEKNYCKMKRQAIFHKRDRVRNNKECQDPEYFDLWEQDV